MGSPATTEPLADAEARTEAPADRASLWLVGLRDVSLVLLALSVWAGADAAYAVTGTGFSAFLSVADGILVGLGVAGLLHEWGHFAGARVSGGVAPLAPARSFLPLFQFDFQRSEPRHFQAMSIGGNAAHWLVFLAAALLLSWDTPGRLSLVCSTLAFAVFASTTEFPVISRTSQGTDPLEALRGIRRDLLVRNALLGAIAGLLLSALL